MRLRRGPHPGAGGHAVLVAGVEPAEGPGLNRLAIPFAYTSLLSLWAEDLRAPSGVRARRSSALAKSSVRSRCPVSAAQARRGRAPSRAPSGVRARRSSARASRSARSRCPSLRRASAARTSSFASPQRGEGSQILSPRQELRSLSISSSPDSLRHAQRGAAFWPHQREHDV